MIGSLNDASLLLANAQAQQAQASQPAQGDLTADELRERARTQARDFESMFLSTFVQEMFSGIETDGPFGGGHSEEIYRSMMAEQYADTIARSGGIGLADQVYTEILKAQQIEP